MTKHIKLLFVFLVLLTGKSFAQKYQVSAIPDSLKEGANCVIREESTDIELKSSNSGSTKIIRAVTVLNKNGESDASFSMHYDKNSTVNFNTVILYDGNGKLIRKVKDSEIIDTPASYSQVYSETRVKSYRPNVAVYPYTVEYSCIQNYTNKLSFGTWQPLDDYDISMVHSGLKITYPISVKINKREMNLQAPSVKAQTDKLVCESWELNNIKAIEEEPFETNLSERLPAVYLMPVELIYKEYSGLANNWNEYGKWASDLYAGKDILPQAEKVKIDDLLKNVTDTLECIKTLYKYMQEKTRYVAIILGIGGYQPFDAETVSQTGYGDCKALTNYMFSMLKYKGIQSFPALVSSGRYIEPIFTDFPNFSQFDHVILCVPFHPDTIWLECTSQVTPFGFLGDFTDDRQVLLLSPEGGKFAHTKKYKPEENLRTGTSYITIDSIGTANCDININFQGLQYDDAVSLLYADPDDQKKWLYSHTDFPSPLITNFSIANTKEPYPVAAIKETINSRHYGSFSGKYMILPLNLVNIQRPIQKMLKPRLSDILVNRSGSDFDTIIFTVPQNLVIESVPPPVDLSSEFGKYSSSVSLEGNKIIYTRRFSIYQGRYKGEKYKSLYDFIVAISKADNSKVMLKITN